MLFKFWSKQKTNKEQIKKQRENKCLLFDIFISKTKIFELKFCFSKDVGYTDIDWGKKFWLNSPVFTRLVNKESLIESE